MATISPYSNAIRSFSFAVLAFSLISAQPTPANALHTHPPMSQPTVNTMVLGKEYINIMIAILFWDTLVSDMAFKFNHTTDIRVVTSSWLSETSWEG